MLEYVNSFQTALSSTSAYTPHWVQARLEWLEHLWACELEFCKSYIPHEDRDRKLMMVNYEKFNQDTESVVYDMLDKVGVKRGREDPYVREKVHDFVKGQPVVMGGMKKGEGESLETFGINESEINGKFREYIEFFEV